jgi:2-phospho-L-lactate/phosphoenolpyruvate guanylyltransferase
LRVHVVIPLKSAADGKSRLANALTAAERAELVRVMASRVIAAASAVRGVQRVHLLAPERDLVSYDCAGIVDRGAGLNAAVADAARELRAQGAGTMLIVHADLPFVTPDDIGAMIQACGEDALVAAPDVPEVGTNALAFSLSHEITTRFGPESLDAHRLAAELGHMMFRLVRRPGLAYDIDEPTQLVSLVERGGAPYAFLRN